MDTSKTVLAAMLGAAVGWGGQALEQRGRVAAVEQSIVRVEAHLERIDTNIMRVIENQQLPMVQRKGPENEIPQH